MKHSQFIIGIGLLAAALTANIALTPMVFASLYEDILDIEKKRILEEESEDAINEYIPKIYDVTPRIQPDEVETFLSGDRDRINNVCNGRNEYWTGCHDSIRRDVRLYAQRESRIRTLGRDLQLIATGFELPIGDHPGRLLAIAPRLPSLLRVWESTNDYLTNPAEPHRIRAVDIPDTVDGDLTALQDLLEHIDNTDSYAPEALTAVVWRYRYGFMEIKEVEGDCTFEMEELDGTGLQYTKKRWCDIEMHLQSIFDLAPMPTSVQHTETVIYPLKLLRDKGVVVWIRKSNFPGRSDIGLEWEMPLEPVQPSLHCDNVSPTAPPPPECVDGVILAGKYPPPPVIPQGGRKLCRGTFSSKGYLCRPVQELHCPRDQTSEYTDEQFSNGVISPQDPDAGPSDLSQAQYLSQNHEHDIVFRACRVDATVFDLKRTESGPNACQIGGWKESPITIDSSPVIDTPDTDDAIDRPFDCTNCAVDFYCEGNAPDPSLDCTGGFAMSFDKNEDGIMYVCLQEEDISLTYLAIHEMVHVQQKCNLPPRTSINNTLDSCCASEREAYFVECNAMAEDGIFNGTEIDLQICANVLTNESCKQHGLCTQEYTPQYMAKIKQQIAALVGLNPAGVPTKCEDVINSLDPRVELMKTSLPLSCSDECTSKYENTIGNNACYIAQCTEQSIETHRLFPGRMTFLAQDSAFPWDSEAPPNPRIGSMMMIPPVPVTSIPTYDPELIARSFDLALCQLNGDPLLTPPSKCQFDAVRQLALQGEGPVETGAGLIDQAAQSERVSGGLRSMAPSIGTRIGTNLYYDYLNKSMRAFSDIVHSANTMIEGISDIEFPADMCPRLIE